MAKILIIDDEVDMCWAISNVLEGDDHSTISANDGPEGLRIIEEERPDLVLLDIRLPGMDGAEVLKKIKIKHDKLPVIMITGYGSVDSAVEVMKTGAFDYISKPFDNEKLLSTVQKAIGINDPNKDEKKLKLRGALKKNYKEKIRREGRAIRLSGGVLVKVFIIFAIILMGFGLFKVIPSKTVSYKIPYFHISSIVYDSEFIWTSDWFSQNIYKHKVDEKLTILKTYHLPDIHPAGLAWDGESFWATDSWTKNIYKLDPDNNFIVMKSFKSPGDNPGAVMWDGRNIWTADAGLDKIFKHNMDDILSVVSTFNSPATSPSGLARGGETIWSCDADTNKLYKHSMDINLSVVDIYELEEYSSAVSVMSGFCWDGKYFWTCPEGANRIFRHSLSRMKIRKIFGVRSQI